MESSPSLPELVAAAQANAAAHEDQIAGILTTIGGQTGSDTQLKDLWAARSAIELLAVDIFAVFEARMQHHFKRGPFSRKLQALLIGAGQPDLARRIQEYYLIINVLKHGTGVSHRELLKTQSRFLTGKPDDNSGASSPLVDVTVPGFFDGLSAAITDAYHFLER